MARKLRSRPSVGPEFFKAHGHGNDYLVFDEGAGPVLSPSLVRRICSRRRGVGSDGIVVAEAVPPGAEPRLRMFNPDGHEFERSGNGLRIAGVYLWRKRRVEQRRFSVVVRGDRVWLDVAEPDADGAWDVRVEMGRAGFPSGPPFLAPGRAGTDGRVRLVLDGPKGDREIALAALPVSIGNPHAVIFGDQWSDAEVECLGPQACAHEAFPEGTNVQFARVRRGGGSRRSAGEAIDVWVDVWVWERGAGRTESSGTSACAVAVAAVKEGLVAPGAVRVVMEGGEMEVDVDRRDWGVRLRGPVREVFAGRLADGLLASLGAHPELKD